jgi:hypothetical protein
LLDEANLSVSCFLPGAWRGKGADSFDKRLKPDLAKASANESSQDILIVKA